MPRSARILIGFIIGSTVLVGAAVGATAAAFYHAGSIDVAVQPDDGSRVAVRVPAALADVAIVIAPDDLLAELSDELEPLRPTLQAIDREFDRLPDFTLLEVKSKHEHVKILKRGGDLVVHVESDGESVHVELPVRLVQRLMRKLDGAIDAA